MRLIPTAPRHALDALAVFELRDYRAALERALTGTPAGTLEHKIIGQQLAAVVAQQSGRARNPEPSGTWSKAP